MENYENNTYSEENEEVIEPVEQTCDGELIEAEVIEAGEDSDVSACVAESDGETEDTEADTEACDTDETEPDEEDDISAVAEMLATIRNPFVVTTEAKKAAGANGGSDKTDADGGACKNGEWDECGLFTGFTLKKALVTAAIVLVSVVLIFAAMAAAVKVSEDKTRRESDYDMIVDEAAEESARKNSDADTPTVPSGDEKQFKVTLDFFDRDDIELYTTKITLGELLEKSGIELDDGEECTVSADTMIGSETTVAFDKYTTETYTETASIPYESTVYETDLIPRGSTRTVQEGVSGESRKTYENKLKNGEIISTELLGEETISLPQDYIYELGVGGTFVGGDGKTYSYSYKKTVKATYYYLPNDPHTYLGNTPDHQTVAVDMNVIPLGTWFYVKNSKYDFGLRQAQDIGGAVKGDMIDIWLDGSEPGYSLISQEGIVYDMEVYFID